MIGTTLTRMTRPPDCCAMATAEPMAGRDTSTSARSIGTTMVRNMALPLAPASGKLLLQKCDGPPPGLLCSFSIVACSIGIVVESVVNAVIDEDLVPLAVLLQRGLKGWDAGIDALVEPGI